MRTCTLEVSCTIINVKICAINDFKWVNISAVSILNSPRRSWRIGIHYGPRESTQVSTKLPRRSRNSRKARVSLGHDADGILWSDRRVLVGFSMFGNAVGIRSLSHLRRFQRSTTATFSTRCVAVFLYKSFTFFYWNLHISMNDDRLSRCPILIEWAKNGKKKKRWETKVMQFYFDRVKFLIILKEREGERFIHF